MKKIFGLTIAAVLFLGMTGIGTWAYFADIETSQTNTLAAGTLDLKTGATDGVSQTLLAAGMAPGDAVGPETIVLNNIGSIEGSSLDLSFTYVETDDPNPLHNPTDMSADATAALIEVTTLNYAGASIMSAITADNGNGYTDIQDLSNSDLSGQAGIGSSANEVFEIAVRFRSSASHDFQADGITITMTFLLNQ